MEGDLKENPQKLNPETKTANSPIESKKAFKKWVFVAVILIVILSLSMGAYLLLNKMGISPKPSTVTITTPTPDPTANWKTYEDNQFNISFKYPTTMTVVKRLQDPKYDQEPTYYLFIEPIKKDPKKVMPITLLYVYNPSLLSLNVLEEKLTNPGRGVGPGIATSSSSIEVNNSNGVVAFFDKEHYCVSTCQTYTWIHKDQVFQIINYYQEDLNLFNKIFSTFKFTK